MATICFSSVRADDEVAIGEEFIEPIRFAKFSMALGYGMGRVFRSTRDWSLHADLPRKFETIFAYEAGIYQYLNAGGMFSTRISRLKNDEPMQIRLGLFAKPFIPIGNRVALFSKLLGGMAVDVAINPDASAYYGGFNKPHYDRVYLGQNYAGFPFGIFGSATLGIEVFPFSRMGIAFEWGFRASILRTHRNVPQITEVAEVANAPSAFNFVVYEMPITLMLHLIL
jgi:hypothetical protein